MNHCTGSPNDWDGPDNSSLIAASVRARRQRRERFERKRSESAAGDIWAALIAKPGKPKWAKWAAILRGIQTPKCGCVLCAADALTEQAQLEMLRHAKKAY